MGLAITRSILKVHGGGIEVLSTLGKGATFRFWVPLMVKETGGGDTTLEERAARGTKNSLGDALPKVIDTPPDSAVQL